MPGPRSTPANRATRQTWLDVGLAFMAGGGICVIGMVLLQCFGCSLAEAAYVCLATVAVVVGYAFWQADRALR